MPRPTTNRKNPVYAWRTPLERKREPVSYPSKIVAGRGRKLEAIAGGVKDGFIGAIVSTNKEILLFNRRGRMVRTMGKDTSLASAKRAFRRYYDSRCFG